MIVNKKSYRTIWTEGSPPLVKIINQQVLPHRFEVMEIPDFHSLCEAIFAMYLRGAGLIGAAAGYGMYLAVREAASASNFEEELSRLTDLLLATRPTAGNLEWAVRRQQSAIASVCAISEKITVAFEEAKRIADEDADCCRRIGEHGLALIQQLAEGRGGKPVNILTHCNAGWLAFVDYGTALAPVYAAQKAGIPVHVWVDETRPRNQGAALTAWELGQQGIPHHLIVDNAGGHLMQHGKVDLVITGADRVTATGDAANKIGTYLKALAAFDNGVPFYVALPGSTLDWSLCDGLADIPIEERSSREVRYMRGDLKGRSEEVLICPETTPAINYGFDVTPSRLISGFICERGIAEASRAGLARLYPEEAAVRG